MDCLESNPVVSGVRAGLAMSTLGVIRVILFFAWCHDSNIEQFGCHGSNLPIYDINLALYI